MPDIRDISPADSEFETLSDMIRNNIRSKVESWPNSCRPMSLNINNRKKYTMAALTMISSGDVPNRRIDRSMLK
jgi:hypothetical protein